MSKYSINQFYAILDENSDPIEWFDTEEEAEARLEELDGEQPIFLKD